VGFGEVYGFDCRQRPDLPEARFWIASGWRTIRDLRAQLIARLHIPHPASTSAATSTDLLVPPRAVQ
jgi:hypothetical protein